MTPEEIAAALGAMLEQGNQLRASELIPTLVEILQLAASGGGTQEQSDWTQENEQQASYIKHKPDLSVYLTKNIFEKYSALVNDTFYKKTGGKINGDVNIKGEASIDIPDDDYEVRIKASGTLDNNLGTILTLLGTVGLPGEAPTNYRPILRNIGTPRSDYDAATKKYVDDALYSPTYHLVELNTDGSVKQKASSIVYSTLRDNFTAPNKEDILDVLWGNSSDVFTRFHAKCIAITEVNNGDLIFSAFIKHDDVYPICVMFSLDSTSTLRTIAVFQPETLANKVQSIAQNFNSLVKYPSAKAVFDEFQRKPVTVWETDSVGLTGLSTDISDNPAWQLTDLDFSPYKRVKIYTKAAQKPGITASASTTAAMVLEMSLDARAAGPYAGHFVGSVMSQKPNDSNRTATLTCAISADKTSFAVLRMTNIYGTAATDNSDVGAYVFKIVGFYD